MKTRSRIPGKLSATFLVLAATVRFAQAEDLIAKNFDNDLQGFSGGWGAPRDYYWDPSLDADTNALSAALQVDVDFSSEPNTTFQANLSVADYAPYDRVRLSVYLDPTNAVNSSGNFGTISVRLRPTDWGWPGTEVAMGTITNTGWTHFEKPLPADTLSASAGLNIHWNSGFNGPRTIWLDNLIFVERLAPPTPPTLVLSRAVPGLEIKTTGPSDYSRKNVATSTDSAPYMSWLNSTGAVTYAMTVNESVGPDSANFAANIMLCAGNETLNSSPDWNQPSGIFMEARLNTNGFFDVDVRYKTNSPGSHGIRFTAEGVLIQNTNTGLASLVGTWALTLNNQTVTLSGPGGISGSAQLPADALPYFGTGNNFWALFGAQPYTRNNRTISLSRVQITGAGDFTGGVDVDFLTATALSASLRALEEGSGGVLLKPNNTAWRVAWGLPDTGLYLWTSPTLNTSDWVATGLTPFTQVTQRTIFTTNAPSGASFFQLRDTGPAIPPTLLESYETIVPTGANPPYVSITQSTDAGVTEGTYSMAVNVDNSMTWSWITQDFGATVFDDWKKHSKIRFDLHRPALGYGWNLEVQIALNADGAAWTQSQLVNWAWLNAGATTSATLELDYSAMKAAAPTTGNWWQLNLMFRSANGGDVYVDNVRFED